MVDNINLTFQLFINFPCTLAPEVFFSLKDKLKKRRKESLWDQGTFLENLTWFYEKQKFHYNVNIEKPNGRAHEWRNE